MEKNIEKIALFIDYDNTCRNADPRIDFDLIKRFLSDKGLFVFGKVYFNYDKDTLGGFIHKLWEFNMEAVYCPTFPRHEVNSESKSIADPRIIIDIMETLLKNETITTIALMTGDKDFIPLVRKIREYGKKLILIYSKNAASALVDHCSAKSDIEEEYVEAKHYDELETLVKYDNNRSHRTFSIE